MKRKVILYIGMSLDGFIADEYGGVSWMKGNNEENVEIDSYETFYSSIDTIILGKKTYHQIRYDLFPEKWVYNDKESYIITHSKNEDEDNIHFTSENVNHLISTLKMKDGKNIWVCGGAQIVQQCHELHLIDVYHITIIPIILGKGVRLFSDVKQALYLESTIEYNGFVDLIYRKK